MIIITGKNGYIANSLKAYLINNGQSAECVSFRNGADNVDMTGAFAVVHCAAIVHKKERQYRDLYNKINHIESVRLAKKAKAEGIKHFVFISTMGVYGVGKGAVNKDTPCNPVTLYGKSKLAAEKEILKLQGDEFKVTIIRPPMVYGRDCPGNFAKLKKIAAYLPVFPKVNNKRSMLYIENLAYAVNKIINDSICGIVLPMDSEYINTSHMVKKIAACGKNKMFLSRTLGIIAERIPIKVFDKVFGSLYYEKSCAMLCEYVKFDTAIERSV